MKKLIVGVVAVAAVGLGWAVWPAEEIPEQAVVAEDNEKVETLVSSEQRPKDVLPDRVIVDRPAGEEKTQSAAAKEKEEVQDPDLGALDVFVVWRVDARPAAGVQVIVLENGARWARPHVVRTDDRGHARIGDLAPGKVYVSVLRGGENQIRVVAGKTRTARLSIPEGVGVAVQVVDGEGEPVVGAKIWLSERWRTSRGQIVGLTNAHGEQRLKHVSPDCYLAVRKTGFAPSRLYPIRASAGASLPLRVLLRRGGGMIAGRVFDRTGKPVSRAFVMIGQEKPSYTHRSGDGSWSPGPPPTMQRTDDEGRFRADAVPLGKLPVQVKCKSFAPWRGELESLPGSPVPQRIVLEEGAVLRGRVTGADGEAVRYTRITVGEAFSFTSTMKFAGRGGVYEITGLAAGEHRVRAQLARGEAEATVTLVAGQVVEWNPILSERKKLPEGETMLVGRLVDHVDKPLADWRVAARNIHSGDGARSASTDGQGRFRLAVPWKTMRVWAHAPLEWSGFPAIIRDDVSVDNGELLLRVEAPVHRCGEIVGVVVDTNGKPISAQVQLWHVDVRLWRSFDTEAKSGAFKIKNVLPGKVELKICSNEHPWVKLPAKMVIAGETVDVDRVVVQAGGRIEGSVQFPRGRPAPADLELKLYSPDGDEAAVVQYADGKYRSGGVAIGKTYKLRVSGSRLRTERISVQVTRAEAVELNLNLRGAAVRDVQLDLGEGIKRPRSLSLHLRDEAGKLVWSGGRGSVGPLRFSVSAVPGTYRLAAYGGPGPKTWLDVPFVVESFDDKPLLRYTIRPKN